MDNEKEQKAPPENAEAVTNLTEEPSVSTEDIVDLSEVTAESEAVTAAADEGKTEADSAPEKAMKGPTRKAVQQARRR